MIGPIDDCVSTEQCIRVTDWPNRFLISHTRFLWAEVQTDTMEECMGELSVWLMPGNLNTSGIVDYLFAHPKMTFLRSITPLFYYNFL